MLGVTNVRLDTLGLVPKGLHQIDKLSATGSRVQRRDGGWGGGEVLVDPLVPVSSTTGGSQDMAVLRGERPLVLLAVLFFVKLGNIGNWNGIHPDKPALSPTDIPEGAAMPIQIRNHSGMPTARKRARPVGGYCVSRARLELHKLDLMEGACLRKGSTIHNAKVFFRDHTPGENAMCTGQSMTGEVRRSPA